MESWHVFSDPEAMAEEIACQWQEQASQAEKEGRVFSVVLSGGSTASRIYRRLAEQDYADRIPWHVVHFFWADERCVPPENEESNYGNCRRFLLGSLTIPDENIHRIRGEEAPAAESARYEREIQNHMRLRKNRDDFFDWVLLGVGSDGHTASLFPGQDALNSANLCEEVSHPQTGQMRITLTPLAIKKSNHITFHVIGQGKARIVSEMVSESCKKSGYPAAHIQGEWFLDRKAASSLSPESEGS